MASIISASKQNEKEDECDGHPDSKNDFEPDSALKHKKREEKGAKGLETNKMKMRKLENFLFGSLYDPIEFGGEAQHKQDAAAEDGGDAALYLFDKSMEGDDALLEELESHDKNQIKYELTPAWVDDEEDKMNVDILNVNRLKKLRREDAETLITGPDYVTRLRAQHIKLNPGTEWAQLNARSHDFDGSDDESDVEDGVALAQGYEQMEGDDILRSNEEFVVKSTTKLLPGVLEYSRLTDANAMDPSNGPIKSVQFHRNAQLLLTAGLDRRLRFFQIDGKRNPEVQSFFLEDCPIRKAAFSSDGSQVFISGRRKFFYSFDLVKAKVDKIGPLIGREEKSLETFAVSPDSKTIAFIGNVGHILLVSSRTKDLIGTLKMKGSVRTLAFANDGQQLLSSGGDGLVYLWDLRMRSCLYVGVDEGCLTSTALCSSPDSSLFAAGSTSGIVNVYNKDEFVGGKAKPLKTIGNLVTKVDDLKFNHDSQILAIISSTRRSSMKLIHIPSYTAFSNWAAAENALHYPSCIDFSPGGGFMVVGNGAGKVFLYRLHHYHNA